MSQSSDIGQNLDGDISDVWISGQSLINKNCHNTKTSNDIGMKLVSVSKLDKRNTVTSKNDDDVIPAYWDVIVFFLIFGQFGAIQKLGYSYMVCETYVLHTSNLSCYKNWKRNLKISNTAFILLLWVKVLSLIKNANFLQKNADISKIKWVLVLKGIFSKTMFVCVFRYQVLSF